MATWPHTYDMHRLEADKPLFLNDNNLDAFAKDLEKSKTVIEKDLDIDPITFAYHFGNTNDKVAQVIKDAGFELAAILAPQSITVKDDAYYLNRIVTNPETFESIILPYVEKQKKDEA